MSIPVILGLLLLIGFVADIVGRSTLLPRVTLLMPGGESARRLVMLVAGIATIALFYAGEH